jgi:hypothetical protein
MWLTSLGVIAKSSISNHGGIMRAAMIVLFCLSFPTGAFAWGEEGHAIVAEIAQRRLSPQAAAMVVKLLGPGHSLASIANWADEFRANGGAEGKKTTNWHFVNIPIAKNDYVEVDDRDECKSNPEKSGCRKDCKSDPEKGDCIVKELNRLRQERMRTSSRRRSKRSNSLSTWLATFTSLFTPWKKEEAQMESTFASTWRA